MLLLIWAAMLFTVRISVSTGPSSHQKKEQGTLTCTVPCPSTDKKNLVCTSGHNETHNEGNNVERVLSSTVIINLSDDQHGTTVTCRVNLTGDMLKENTVTLKLTYKADLPNITRNETNTTDIGSNSNRKPSRTKDAVMMLLETVKQPEVIVAFFMGFLLATLVSTVVCCLMRKSHRKKLKIYGNLSDALEMTTVSVAAAGRGAVAAGNSDVDYSTIKFSAVKRANKLEEMAETEYAEIKREEMVQEEDGEGSQEEVALTEEVELGAENGGMMDDEDAAHCADVEVVVNEMEACSV